MLLQADGSWDKKYCLLPLWHAPLDPRSDPNQHKPADCTVTDVFISEDGCLLPCKCVFYSCTGLRHSDAFSSDTVIALHVVAQL